ncbi:DUF1415 domain-containing protein [Vibrio caribbeanicus]|uniref:Uncharacterized protein n=1 Tax=Vibrio caribbeanicus ATCC BAA-2122 TaxID=796620 RepID=E3BNT3_9VIBR|nr:DUF1415 domain-containing protein [Vibrio caribbeanicus]EFP95327.1 hypothetical protein VIBC2010_14869 [Vibrio caribbeanicus ATCC BAA-2122]MCY9845610.1 DUF1415 domain-containing protein [Vibrio caribbeanicus]
MSALEKPSSNTELITREVGDWLNNVVIGLNLCPFAAKPMRNRQIKTFVSHAETEETLLQDILEQLLELESTSSEKIDTTLVVVPNMLSDFYDYNLFIDWIEALLRQQNWQGIFQLATFHPNYCFGGTEPEDAENLTNRSPYPIFHLLREDSMEKVLKHYPDPESIPDKNIERVESLSENEKQQLFPYLYKSS